MIKIKTINNRKNEKKNLSQYNSKNRKILKNYDYRSSSVFEMLSLSLDVWWCGEGWGGGGRGWRLCTRWWITTPHLLEVIVDGGHPLLHESSLLNYPSRATSFSSMYLLSAYSSCLYTDSCNAWTQSWISLHRSQQAPVLDTESREYDLL